MEYYIMGLVVMMVQGCCYMLIPAYISDKPASFISTTAPQRSVCHFLRMTCSTDITAYLTPRVHFKEQLIITTVLTEEDITYTQ